MRYRSERRFQGTNCGHGESKLSDQSEVGAEDSEPKKNALEIGCIHRPPFQLRSLPIRLRWEVTRRHPYYQDWWQEARNHHLGTPLAHPAAAPIRQAAVVILGAIGVSGNPPDPATDFGDLEAEQLGAGWLTGAVHPITMRGMAALLIAALPKETVGYLGLKFVEAGCDDKDGQPPRKIKAMSELATLDKPGLDSFVDEPIVCVNPAASGRQVTEAIQELMRKWKDQRGLSEQRDRSDKHDEYLRAWDLREGWTGTNYDRNQELHFRDIAKTLRKPIDTVSNHYQNAFAMIVGHPYSPELWRRTMGPLKLSDLYGNDLGPVSRRRPLRSRVRRDVAETVIDPQHTTRAEEGSDPVGPVTSVTDNNTGPGAWELVTAIVSLIQDGKGDQEIADELDMSDAALKAIAYLRNRPDEFVL